MSGLLKKIRKPREGHVFTTLNLTALIDLFTILVLFLLFHLAGGEEMIPPSKNLQLPTSVSEQSPEATVTIMVTRDDISVEGKIVGVVDEILGSEDILIPGLKEELSRHAEIAKSVGRVTGLDVFQGKITILGDEKIPFRLLEKIMFTCSESEYPDINLAVLQKEAA